MAGTTDRLRNLVADELGECCDGDLETRLDALHELDDRTDDGRAEADLAVLSALAGETRYRLVRLLAAADGELCVCELLPLMDVSDSAVSHALSKLSDAGLVERRREGRWRYYDATDRAEALLAALDAPRGDAGRTGSRTGRATSRTDRAEGPDEAIDGGTDE